MPIAELAADSAEPPFLLVVAVAAAGAAASGVFAALHSVALGWWTDYLYYEKKVLKRRHPNVESDPLWAYFAPMAVLTLPPVLLLSRLFLRALWSGTLDLDLNLADCAASLFLLAVLVDANYYFAHRAMHEFPFLYRSLHKHHHHHHPRRRPPTDPRVAPHPTARPNHTTTYAEHLLAATPALLLWVLLLSSTSAAAFNPWPVLLPAATVIMETNTMHAGFLDHYSLYVASPLRACLAPIPGVRRRMAAEHELHHKRGNVNYAPVFRWLDLVGGTNAAPDVAEYVAGE
ncbi:hypothetical protein DFJ73DRAFT_904754 [Zopfochytrium polystomum]|nr:hypothetical protein DFJ73DRAFT_904754 [Zopfochytrium polystomum]